MVKQVKWFSVLWISSPDLVVLGELKLQTAKVVIADSQICCSNYILSISSLCLLSLFVGLSCSSFPNSYAPINVMPDYGLGLGKSWGWWENEPPSFLKVVGICHCRRSIHFDFALPHTNPRFCYWEICWGYVGECTTPASPVRGEL